MSVSMYRKLIQKFSNVASHISLANLRILLLALKREPLDQILRNLRRVLASKLPKARAHEKKVDRYQQFIQREHIPPVPRFDSKKLVDWTFPHTDTYILSDHAASEVIAFLAAHPQVDIIYCDEDQMDKSGKRHAPYFKPAWSPENILATNYIGEPLAVRTSILPPVQVDRWDFWLGAVEKKHEVVHLPKVLMHRVNDPISTSLTSVADMLQAYLIQQKVAAKAIPSPYRSTLNQPLFHLQWPDTGPLVSILIPSKNNYKLLKSCLDALAKTTYKQYETLVLDNASDEPQTLNFLTSLQHNPSTRVLRIPNVGDQFSFSYINNEGVKAANGKLILFLNDDTEVVNPTWLSQMVGYHSLTGVGLVGAKLLYPDGSLQHVGVGTGMYTGNFEGFPVHYFAGRKADDAALIAHTQISNNVMAVTGACCLIAKALFETLGGFDEARFPLSFNDIDLCLRVHQAGHRIVMAHDAVLIHKESKSRKGLPEYREMINYKRKYKGAKDAYYNPNLSLVNPFEIRPTAAGMGEMVFVREMPNTDMVSTLSQVFCVLVPSHRMRTYVEKIAPNAVVEVKKTVLDTESMLPYQGISKEEARAKLGFAKDKIVFINYSGIAPYISHQVFTRVAKKLSQRYPNTFDFCLLTGREEDDLLAFLAADIFVNTKEHGTEVKPMLLAMYLGLPIISYADIGMQEYMLEGLNGLLVPTGSVSQLRKAMEKIGTDAALRDSFGQMSKEVLELT